MNDDRIIAEAVAAARAGDQEKLLSLIGQGLEVPRLNEGAENLLIIALASGMESLVPFLLQHGAALAASFEYWVFHGNVLTPSMFRRLRAYGAVPERYFYNCFEIAAESLSLEWVKTFVELGANINYPDLLVLRYAARRGDVQLLEYLLQLGAKPDALPNSSVTLYSGKTGTALMEAAQNGKLEALQLLISYGADPFIENQYGLRAVDFARWRAFNRDDNQCHEYLQGLETPEYIAQRTESRTSLLPPELVDDLQSGSLGFFDCRGVTGHGFFLKLPDVRFATLLHTDGSGESPYRYKVPAVDLADVPRRATKDYALLNTLSYIPALNCFATFDNDHDAILVFRGVDWREIRSDLCAYLNAEWNSDTSYLEAYELHRAFPHQTLARLFEFDESDSFS